MTLAARAAVLFDRDGVLNVDEGYSFEPSRLVWVKGALQAVRTVNQAGALAIVITNQSGIGRGYYSEAQMHAFHQAMTSDLADAGARLDDIYYCPFHEDALEARYRHPDHPDRKPNPGMLLRAMREHQLTPDRVVMIGDKQADMQAAERAHVRGILFQGGDLEPVVADALRQLKLGSLPG